MKKCIYVGLLFFIGCAPGVYINKDFLDKDYTGKKISVAQIDSVIINYMGSLDEEFGKENQDAKIGAYICGMTATMARDSSVLTPATILYLNGTSFREDCLRLGGKKDSFWIRVPTRVLNQRLLDSSDITLILDNSAVYSAPYVQIVTVGFIPIPIPHKPLTISSKFLFWDNRKNAPLVWGFASGTSDGGVAITKTQWKESATYFADNVVRKSPFRKKRK